MSETLPREAVLRPRRQLTLPARICERLGLEAGDRIEIALTEGGLLLRPKKNAALLALREIHRAFAEAGITEEELLEEGRRVREELTRKYYGGT